MAFNKTNKNSSTGKYYAIRNASSGKFVKDTKTSPLSASIKKKYGKALKKLGDT